MFLLQSEVIRVIRALKILKVLRVPGVLKVGDGGAGDEETMRG